MEENMKLGIIGTGMIVREFLPELVKMEGLEIRSIMGSPAGFEKAQALSEQFGIPKAAHDLDELCAAGIDTVYVAIPNSLHFMYCKKALEKEKNVIVMKKNKTYLNDKFFYVIIIMVII